MKKILFLMVCMVMAAAGHAQSHSFRDTSYVRYEQFDFDAWLLEDTSLHRAKVCRAYPLYPYPSSQMVMGYCDLLQYNYADNPSGMEVVGLSACVSLFPYYGLDSLVPTEYLLLYDAMTDTFQLQARVPWYETDTAGRPFFDHYERYQHHCNSYLPRPVEWVSGHGYLNASIFKIFDCYFDKPITVYDSFYVGATNYFWQRIYTQEDIPISRSGYVTFSTTDDHDTACYSPSLWKMYFYASPGSAIPSYQWFWRPTNQFLMVLPIIRVVDTSFANAPECPRVSGLFVRGNNTDTVTMQWNYDSLHSNFELTYGPEGTPPGEGAYRMLNTNRWQFSDVAYLDTPMVAYVRTVCREYDTLRWSRWSSPMYFRLHHEEDTTHPGDVGVPDDEGDLSRFVQLMPNPASGSVVVMSSYGIDRVEVYDVRGNRVLEQKGQNRATYTGFDVSAWAKGPYVVLVHTPAGTTARRLMVQ